MKRPLLYLLLAALAVSRTRSPDVRLETVQNSELSSNFPDALSKLVDLMVWNPAENINEPRTQIFLDIIDARVNDLLRTFSITELKELLINVGRSYLCEGGLLNLWITWWQENKALMELFGAEVYNPRRNPRVERLLMLFIRQLIVSRRLDLGDMMIAFINGSGTCAYLFLDPDVTNFSQQDKLLAKLGYFVSLVQDSVISSEDTLLALKRLSLVCFSLRKEPLLMYDDKHKLFIHSLLDPKIEDEQMKYFSPLSSLTYIRGPDDVCHRLVSLLNKGQPTKFDQRFFKQVTKGLFIEACLSDLIEIWSKEFHSSWGIYYGSLYDRWMNAIVEFGDAKLNITTDNYMDLYDAFIRSLSQEALTRPEDIDVQRIFDPRNDVKFGAMLRKVVKQVSSISSHLAYLKGKGICNMIDSDATTYLLDTLTKLSQLWHRGFSIRYIRPRSVKQDFFIINMIRFNATCLNLKKSIINGASDLEILRQAQADYIYRISQVQS